MASLSLKHIYKVYQNGVQAVSDFCMDIDDKEFIVFVGPSGCGKSTTLRMIAGLEIITAGELYIGDKLVTDVEPKDRDIAMVFQNYALYPHMSVYDNMAFGLTLAKIPKEERQKDKALKLNFFQKLFGRTLMEDCDLDGNVLHDENGNVRYVTKKKKDGSDKLDKNGNVIYKKRGYTLDETCGPVVLDENGNKKYLTYKYTKLGLLLSKTRQEELDENGKVVLDENGKPIYVIKKNKRATTPLEQRDENGNIMTDEAGNPVYVVKKDKKSEPVLDANGNPIYVMRKYTEEEILEGKLPDLIGKDGKPVYVMRKYTKEEIASLIGTTKFTKDGEPVYKRRKYKKYEIKQKVLKAADILGITEYLERKPKAMSGGQRQRVALGRAIVRNPKVFLLDEPLSNLDAKLRTAMRTEITKLHKKLQTTFIYVTHDQVEAMTMGTRIVVMKDGLIQQIGAPNVLYDHPANKFVAGFLGNPQMNFYNGTIEKNGTVTFANGQVLKLTDNVLKQLDVKAIGDSKEIVLGMRPDDLHLAKDGEGFKCCVEMVEELGGEAILYCDLDVSERENITEGMTNPIVAKVSSRNNINQGDIITLSVDINHIHVFDAATENTLCLEDQKYIVHCDTGESAAPEAESSVKEATAYRLK